MNEIGDLEKEREVSMEEGKMFAGDNDLDFFETSAKNSVGVEKVPFII